ncbi:N-acetyldiaminopimelate deacetylase [Weissella diestrammenae]|uniref:N-acetyldiaminopimelate deacetylase n=1 Tax=Weissella diestrammenae TaxID=1162633 RepID=A0A7G9T487_9LACO|nr:N-acetyldiaminopimelate deacetylase [Weissella diestrammenae]MCM0583440.1 N-acetyldiaminopimelate deacetylase [Weissella diestrammenae]QNN74912.1 N-acetyldiaminopimelate deacetylase [Weissella diestrammenae]
MVYQEEKLIEIRRELHQIPELGMQEFKTHEYLMTCIEQLNQQWLTIKQIPDVPTAIMVRLQGYAPDKTIGWRSDMDGLPVLEATQLPFASQHIGQMHACGHDMHMAIAMGILAHFADNQPRDNMVFFFQPAEETIGGGIKVYEAGVFQGIWQPDEFYAFHDQPALATGVLSTRQGTLFAAAAEVRFTISGRGSHAAYPQKGLDAIVAGSALVTQLQTIVSRSLDPVHNGVITIGTFQAGEAGNIIANQAVLTGTIRTLRQSDIEVMFKRVQEIAKGVATMFAVEVLVEIEQSGYLAVENDTELVNDFIRFMAQSSFEFEVAEPAMTGEDFGFLMSKFKGMMFWLGVGDMAHPLHHAKMTPDESALKIGVDASVAFLAHRMESKSYV